MATCFDGGETWDFLQTETGIAWQSFEWTSPALGLRLPKKKVSVGAISAPGIRPGSPLAAIKGGAHKPARLYYCNTDGVIREVAESNKKWSVAPDALPKVHAQSGLAATCWDGLKHIRLYYQDEQGRLREHRCDDGKWAEGAILTDPMEPVPLTALGMLASFGPSGPYEMVEGVFYQRDEDVHSIEKQRNGSWSKPMRLMPGARDPSSRFGEAIAVAGDPSYHNAPLFEVFYQIIGSYPAGADDLYVKAYLRHRSGHNGMGGQATITPPKDLANRGAMTAVYRAGAYILGWIGDDGWFNRR